MVASTCTVHAAPWRHEIGPFPYKINALPWPAQYNPYASSKSTNTRDRKRIRDSAFEKYAFSESTGGMADQNHLKYIPDTGTSHSSHPDGGFSDVKTAGSAAAGENDESSPVPSLRDWRLRLLTIGTMTVQLTRVRLCHCVFLSALDITIVSTSLTAIANDLHAFEQSSWVVSSYLTCYFSFLIIWAKLSDFFGRKLMLVAAVLLFLGFSGGCGGSQTPVQLIICRALQGIGGAGIFSMVPIIVAEMVEPARYAKYNAIISLAIAFSFLLGPLLGGAISDGTTWRWIFWINLPVGFIGLLLVLFAMPAEFPAHSENGSRFTLSISPTKRDVPTRGSIDYPGFVILLAASIMLIVAIEEAGISFSWSSALVIAFLVVSGVLLILFLSWEWYLYHTNSTREPIFPWAFIQNRILMGIYLSIRTLKPEAHTDYRNALLSGVPMVTLVLELPLRFMSVNGRSGLTAGIDILPFTLMIAFGSALSGGLTTKGRVPPFLVLLFATTLQVLGVGLLFSVPIDTTIPARIYGYEVLAGLGTGLSLTTLLSVTPFLVERHALAVAMGGVTQLRILGGAIGVSAATNLLNNTAREKLATSLPIEVLARTLRDISSVKTLSLADQSMIHAAFAAGYHKQLAMILGFCAAEYIALMLMWEWPMRRLA
ncbi:hypothetical protein N7507_001398 [Penicillium longicatenatum]|nr:hypothetical protein N7507_001398 [Penicillium longicatenatum]